MKIIESDGRQGTNDFDYDFRHDPEYREENAELKKQVADYKDFIRNLNTKNQDIAGDIIKQLI